MLSLYDIKVNTSSLADGQSIAAYLTSAAGVLLTHSTAGAKELLDVMDAASHAEGATFTAGDYGQLLLVKDSSGNYATITLTAAGQVPVSMDGTFAEDSAHSSGAMGLHVLAVRKDAAGASTDTDGDYSSLQTWADGSLKVVDIPNEAIKTTVTTAGLTAVKVVATPLARRRVLEIQNISDKPVFIGSSTVTTSGATQGIELRPNNSYSLSCGPGIEPYVICGNANRNILVLELA